MECTFATVGLILLGMALSWVGDTPVLSASCSSGFCGGATYYLVNMQRKRDDMRKVTGKGW